ncbi:transglutaminase-like domain-containing protein [Flavobacterium sp.]|uniref:transglutaminase-like domain-containing protein n=1 Tax=Flavobacterium sp. TaxID=239 RepID=UPI0037510B94
MTKDEINQALKRPIKNGSEFDKLIEKPNNEQKQFKKGNTFYSVSVIKFWVINFYWQVAKLSKVLLCTTLEETTKKIHSFLYEYIQYQADGTVQFIRSPSNSWLNRQKGIDCKSYSVFASSILANLGIKHYIRQIKQPSFNPDKFTHVYVVVPIDQQTGSLAKGHNVIDGTILSNKEPIYTLKKDVFMEDELPHIGLNGADKKGKKASAKKPSSPTKKGKKSKGSTNKIFAFM